MPGFAVVALGTALEFVETVGLAGGNETGGVEIAKDGVAGGGGVDEEMRIAGDASEVYTVEFRLGERAAMVVVVGEADPKAAGFVRDTHTRGFVPNQWRT